MKEPKKRISQHAVHINLIYRKHTRILYKSVNKHHLKFIYWPFLCVCLYVYSLGWSKCARSRHLKPFFSAMKKDDAQRLKPKSTSRQQRRTHAREAKQKKKTRRKKVKSKTKKWCIVGDCDACTFCSWLCLVDVHGDASYVESTQIKRAFTHTSKRTNNKSGKYRSLSRYTYNSLNTHKKKDNSPNECQQNRRTKKNLVNYLKRFSYTY